MKLPKPLRLALLIALGVALGGVAALIVYALTIHTPLENVAVAEQVPPAGSPEFIEQVALHTHTSFAPGHSVELALDGAGTYPRLWNDIRAARRSVMVQLYFCLPGALADSLAAALADRARAGVTVRFLYDGFGCDLGGEYYDRLSEAGVRVRAFRPVRWWSLHKAQERSHARIVVIDGTVGYTGGFGIDDRWSAAGADGEAGWRDTNVRFTGPAVASLQAAFADGWAESAAELILVEPGSDTVPAPRDAAEHMPADSVRGAPPDSVAGQPPDLVHDGVLAGMIHSIPDLGSTTAERLLVLTIAGARRTLYIANAYFVPDDDFRRMLGDAVGRGVDVRILTPDAETDVPVVRYAARAHYEELLDAGVRIWEYRPRMMHAKTFVVDGVWSAVGSMNFDNRSLAVNEETALLVADRDFGARMDSLFLGDLEDATEITLDTFRERGFGQKVRERLAVLTSRLL